MNLEIHYADNWAALYVDGKLEIVGDTYRTEEEALSLAGVITVHDPSFMCGQTSRAGVAPTLNDVIVYRTKREAAERRAAELEEQARTLIAEAESLRGTKS